MQCLKLTRSEIDKNVNQTDLKSNNRRRMFAEKKISSEILADNDLTKQNVVEVKEILSDEKLMTADEKK